MQNNPDQSMRHINSVENNRSNMDSKDIQWKRSTVAFFWPLLLRQGSKESVLLGLISYWKLLLGVKENAENPEKDPVSYHISYVVALNKVDEEKRKDPSSACAKSYFAAIVAGLWPDLVKSDGLINTAGSVEPRYSSFPATKGRDQILSYEDGKDFQQE
ncbi:hypothetical protein NE237_030170 [Protea cynaroides]|uniref:Uncharacterized protein n=1 Tax=Protea cynaroides TaxID=273540 RepID=A0A9Q0GT69_9MAGN|nr:hypothetical protein NE237_030170 [Protea cynaroides]